jgi:carboxyl-terminal processing protease
MKWTSHAWKNLNCSLIALWAIAQFTFAQTPIDGNLTATDRAFVTSKIYGMLQLYFSGWKACPGLEFDNVYRLYLQRGFAADTRREFDLASIEFVAQLHNGHTFFWDVRLDKSNDQPLGFYAIPLDGKWVVQTSFLEKPKPGDIISSIDSTPIEALFLQQRRYISASSTAAQRRNLFLFPYLFPEQFKLTLEDGRELVFNRAILTQPPPKTEGRWVRQGDVAFIRIPEFFDPALEGKARDYVRQFRHAKVLLVDVRGNPGGVSPRRLIEALMNRPYRGWSELSNLSAVCDPNREAVSRYETNHNDQVTQGSPNPSNNGSAQAAAIKKDELNLPKPDAYQGRLIFLVDGGCVSACEDLIEPSKESGRATLVGETTQGSSGVPLIYDFRNGMTLRIAAKRYLFPDGSEFEGIGIKPDIEVHTTIEDLKAGRDPVFERALQLASNP